MALAAISAAQSAGATTISDPAGDFLSTFTGPFNSDLDILSVTALIKGSNFVVSATLAGPLGQTAGADYVFGVNTGKGLPLFSTETKVLFDSAIVLNTGGGVVADDIVGTPTVTPLAAGAVTVSGDTITGVVPIALLPSLGFDPQNYGFNLWSRIGISSNFPVGFADFAPDNNTFRAVPEPASWALMIMGFGALGGAVRARRRTVAA